MKRFAFSVLGALFAQVCFSQTGSAAEPVSYVGGEICNPRLHDGGFRYAIGTENIQVMRANRTHGDWADGFGWTYNHAPNLTYWNGKFYLEYLSNPVDEQQPPGQTLLVTSADGRRWSKPQVVFPVYKAPAGVGFPKGYYGYIMHQRMGFYTAPNGRLLVVGFYGHSYNPFKAGGIGRVVREVRRDGKAVALWKWSFAALSVDEGEHWSSPVRCQSLIMAGGKQWGQRTQDGRYALCYNPIETQPYRYPLVVMTGDDGIVFDSIGVVHGEVPPRRFMGENKDFGPCYVRGITEGEQVPGDGNLWVTYSVNKEDIWVSRIPLRVKTTWKGDVNDNFERIKPGGVIADWNIYRPQWCDIRVDDEHRLCLTDADRYDYARAIRVFETGRDVEVSLDVLVAKENADVFEMDVTDAHGTRAVSLALKNGRIIALGETVGEYEKGKWAHIAFRIEGGRLRLNGRDLPLLHAVKAVERLSLRTGEYRDLPNRQTPNQVAAPPLQNCDEKLEPSVYLVDNVRIRVLK